VNKSDISAALLFVALLLVLTVSQTGCTSNGMKAEVMGANIEIAKARTAAASKPILDATIPTPNGVMRIVVHAPQSPTNSQVAIPEDPMWRVLDRGMGVLGTAAGIYLGGEAATNIVRGTSAGIVDALRVQPAPTVVEQPAPIVTTPTVVEQPPPLVVTAPDPIVVTQPAPVIVNPVFQ
jgi:hypothetical protein